MHIDYDLQYAFIKILEGMDFCVLSNDSSSIQSRKFLPGVDLNAGVSIKRLYLLSAIS